LALALFLFITSNAFTEAINRAVLNGDGVTCPSFAIEVILIAIQASNSIQVRIMRFIGTVVIKLTMWFEVFTGTPELD